MQPTEANVRGDVASKYGSEDAREAAQANLPPTLQGALQRMLDQPDAHTIGDLAALTDRMTSEMMLFGALVGDAKCTISAGPTVRPLNQSSDNFDGTNAAQALLHAEFICDLET